MIKVIKHSDKIFHKTCQKCGCEFTYEHEDITLPMRCPDCGAVFFGFEDDCDLKPLPEDQLKEIIDKLTDSIYKDVQKRIDKLLTDKANELVYHDYNFDNNQINPFSYPRTCNDCEWFKQMTSKKGAIYVGDTPCTWCHLNTPMCNTVTSSVVHQSK